MKYCCLNNQRSGTCYFEFQKGIFHDRFWMDDSLYLLADIFDSLNLYELFIKRIPKFDYYGETQINSTQWKKIKSDAESMAASTKSVINEIDMWAKKCCSENIFTILGI